MAAPGLCATTTPTTTTTATTATTTTGAVGGSRTVGVGATTGVTEIGKLGRHLLNKRRAWPFHMTQTMMGSLSDEPALLS